MMANNKDKVPGRMWLSCRVSICQCFGGLLERGDDFVAQGDGFIVFTHKPFVCIDREPREFLEVVDGYLCVYAGDYKADGTALVLLPQPNEILHADTWVWVQQDQLRQEIN